MNLVEFYKEYLLNELNFGPKDPRNPSKKFIGTSIPYSENPFRDISNLSRLIVGQRAMGLRRRRGSSPYYRSEYSRPSIQSPAGSYESSSGLLAKSYAADPHRNIHPESPLGTKILTGKFFGVQRRRP